MRRKIFLAILANFEMKRHKEAIYSSVTLTILRREFTTAKTDGTKSVPGRRHRGVPRADRRPAAASPLRVGPADNSGNRRRISCPRLFLLNLKPMITILCVQFVNDENKYDKEDPLLCF
jgi:hypothetical protein